jgi:hypothetical protein
MALANTEPRDRYGFGQGYSRDCGLCGDFHEVNGPCTLDEAGEQDNCDQAAEFWDGVIASRRAYDANPERYGPDPLAYLYERP